MTTKHVLMSSSKIRHQRALKYVIIWNVNSQRVRVITSSDFKNINFINVGHTPRRRITSAHAAHVPARLQAAWAELVRRGGWSDQKIKKSTFLRIEKLRI